MDSLREVVDERSKTPLGGGNPEEGSGCHSRQQTALKECDHTRSSRTLLARILELHASGRTPEEIAEQVLTTEPENAVFRAARLVETVLHYARRYPKEENP